MLAARPAFVVASLVILPQLQSQSALIAERARGADAIESYYCEEHDQLGAIQVRDNVPESLGDRAAIEWRVFSGGHAEPVSRVRLPFHTGGAIQRIDECRFLVSGIRYFSLDPAIGVGVICRVRLDESGPAIAIDERVVIGPDPRSLLWDREQARLYLRDARHGKVFAARWAGWPGDDASPCLPGDRDLVEIANLASLPVLGEPTGWLRKSGLCRGGGVLFGADPFDGASSLYRICPLGPVWTVCELIGPGPARWRVEDEALLGIDEMVVVSSAPGGDRLFGVVDLLSGETVAVGGIPARSRSTTVRLPARFRNRPGNPIRILGLGLRDSNVLFPLLRIGEPVPGPSGALTGCILPAGAATVGNARDFAPGTQLRLAAGSTRVSLHLGFAVRGPGDEAPVVDIGGSAALLDAELELALPFGPADLGHFVNDVSHAVPILSDEGLAGSVAFWQWLAVFGDGSLACSDIVGHSIWPRELQPAGAGFSQPSAEAQRLWRRQLEEEGFRGAGIFHQLVGGLGGAR